MPRHNDVPTTCTATQMTEWSIPGLTDKDEKVRVNTRLKTVDKMINGGYKLDFDMIFAITTEKQVRDHGLDDFLPKCGFELAFKGDKSMVAGQRHQETGSLFMWCAHPSEYQKALKEFKAELTALKDKIDPPKKPDPARQKFENLRLVDLRKGGIVFDNASVDNRIVQILQVTPEKAATFITLKFGFDPRKWQGWGDTWTQKTTRMLKDAHVAWKNELV